MRTRWLVLVTVALASFAAGGWLLRRGVRARAASPDSFQSGPAGDGSKLFEEVLRHVRRYAVDSLDESVLYRLAASGVLDELSDPYAMLVSPRDRPSRDDALVLARGAYLDLDRGVTVVVSVRPGSPAAKAGLEAGDAILVVDSTRVETRRPEEIARALAQRGAEPVRIRVARATRRTPLWVTLEPGPVPDLPAPLASPAGDGIAWVRLASIDSVTAVWAGRIADSVTSAGGRGLILDLRGTVEGTLDGAVGLAGVFLSAGTPIVTNRGRKAADSTLTVRGDRASRGIPVVVLVDRGTAGPAEALAGALQDHDRALVVGETSFGRGVTLSSFPLGGGRRLRLTTSLWVTPSGRVIERDQPGDEAADSTAERPKYHTDGGRVVLGGGGIVPDRPVLAEGAEGGTGDPALDLARRLLTKARSTAQLLTLQDR